ncbi:MAG: hypothetical protein LBF61_02100 [Azoarcus sp.]|jgi:hypothetical protein|nr:hypothetical protein [Azoarcus sp.]
MNILEEHPGGDYARMAEGITQIMTLACVMRDMFTAENLRDRPWDLVNLLYMIIDIADRSTDVGACKKSKLFEAHSRAMIE